MIIFVLFQTTSMNKSSLYERVINDKNIYNSIYSIESYVFEKELLSHKDIKLFNELSDKYNHKAIKKVITKCKTKIKSLLNTEELFDVSVFFKPKKFDKETNVVEYRPIHSADLITQICIVSLLNQIMFDDSSGKRNLSDISKLLPSNFYGNIPSTSVESLFEPWNRKYQEYSEEGIEAHNPIFQRLRKFVEWKSNLESQKSFFSKQIDPPHLI